MGEPKLTLRGIVATPIEWMAAEDSPQTAQTSLDGSVFFDRFDEVAAATWGESTILAE